MLKILIVEDDYHIRTVISKTLQHHGYQTINTENGKQGLDVFEQEHIDLVVTDIMMPHVDGYSMVREIRRFNQDVPIIMLTALDTFLDKEKGFTSGADDYMVKPIDTKELVLRIKALLRRYKIVSEHIIQLPHSKLDYSTMECIIEDTAIDLTTKEFQLLFKLLAFPNRIFTREQLMNEIWGFDSESYERTVDTHIKRLRDKIMTNDFDIITVRGLGYKVVLT